MTSPSSRRERLAQRQDYNAGTVAGDHLLHAVAGVGSETRALCGAGRIRYAVPTPFVPGGDDNCADCATEVRGQR